MFVILLVEGIVLLKRLLNHVVWLIIITFVIYLGLRFRVYLGKEAEVSFDNLPIMFFNIIFPIVLGMLFRLPKFLGEKKGKKKWHLDWLKLIAIALPSLYIALLPYLIYTSYGEKLIFTKQLLLLGDTATTLTTIAGLVFGYILVDSMKV